MVQIFATFEHSASLELAISSLEKNGVSKENIFAVPLTNRAAERRLFDTIHSEDGISLLGTGAALATAFAVVGASVGFRLAWGPIYWGLIGTGGGFLLGLLIDLFYYKVVKKQQHLLRGKNSEVILIVECKEEQSDTVESILWHHFAFGLARIESN
ncbi:hypothetical protein A8990_11185 [Paenibacillus taihuensis]|uniref:Uncharacterized protein n=1 Tax=Paenibacillus taihuensis TaxID=1156355 RepID=A0A3D9S7R6_9BACL|nr:hypothetical protein [Paenibacillus taihuensis]REE86188.1 hypothetical protein A8990_11185 [Paenibacillus taihuensis]